MVADIPGPALTCLSRSTTAARVVLVVEDDGDVRQTLRMALSLSGFSVREAADGYQALSEIEQHEPDVVVLDMGLPRLDGLSVLQDLAESSTTRHVPVVIVTGLEIDPARVPAAVLLRKPINPDEVVARVTACLTR